MYILNGISGPGGHDEIRPEQLDEVFCALPDNAGDTVAWRADGDGPEQWVIVAIIDEHWCQVQMLDQYTWYDLDEFDPADGMGPNDEVEIRLGGYERLVRHTSIVLRQRGLEILKAAPDFAQLRSKFSWRSQAC